MITKQNHPSLGYNCGSLNVGSTGSDQNKSYTKPSLLVYQASTTGPRTEKMEKLTIAVSSTAVKVQQRRDKKL